MYIPEALEGVLRRLFGLMSPADVHACWEKYRIEIDRFPMKMLAACCSNRACLIQKFNIPTRDGVRTFQYGAQLFGRKAVNLLLADDGYMITDQVHLIHRHELWLTEDLKFYHVKSVAAMGTENNRTEFVIECRKVIREIKSPADLFFDAEALFCNLYDICYGSFPGEDSLTDPKQ